MKSLQTARIDLHCHSWASNRPTLWLMQRLGCPESYTPPEHVRETAMQRGMDFVTITDHNTIAGVQEILRYDNVVMGQEVTTYFPSDIKIHVVCLGFNQEQHQRIHALRENVFHLVRYLNEEQIVHFCAHPLFKVNGRLHWAIFEKMLLLFKRFEILNGSRWRRMNWAAEQVITHLTPEDIDGLYHKHGIEPVGERPWEKHLVGGSDDHSGLFVGTSYTEVEVEQMTRDALLKGIRAGRTRPCGSSEGCLTLTHQVNSIAYQYYRSKIGAESGELFLVLERILDRKRSKKLSRKYLLQKPFKRLVKAFRKPKGTKVNLIEEIRDVIGNSAALKSLFEEGVMTKEQYNQSVFSLTSDVLDGMILRVARKPQLLHYFLLFAPAILTSYAMTCKNLHEEHDLVRQAENWLGIEREPKVAWFVDSLANPHEVSRTCRAYLEAARRRGKNLRMITSTLADLSQQDGLVNLPPVQGFPTPGIEDLPLYLPSILRTLKYVEDEEFDSIVISTPGPVGLLGLICARLMCIPVHGIYHTDIPRLAYRVSGDPMFGELALILTRMFYRQMDRILVTSRGYLGDMDNLGVPAERVDSVGRWVNAQLFHPGRRTEHYWRSRASCKLLYVGALSRNRNLELLMDLHHVLKERGRDFVIHGVEEGREFEELERLTAPLDRFVMTGVKSEEDLASAYASSDLFVHPGLKDSRGEGVMEAQASGVPCVVMHEGVARELIEPGVTGMVAATRSEFIELIDGLIVDSERRRTMGAQAAEYAAVRFAEETVFENFWRTVSGEPPTVHRPSSLYFMPKLEEEELVVLTA